MKLIVDFNMRESDGRLPALLTGAADELTLGDTVIAADGEGLEVTARVSEVLRDGRYAMLETVGGTYRESDYRPTVGDLYAGH
ncbi:MAG TPA: hypothetical protein VE569_07675 [Acidimicrobiia bacterium]|jgi:hypothetical protein|nr:hypothetical protein [Acidimicrobiia bacterium]